jgi:FMN phosphatase YigB (HAD superfamily)
MTHAPEYGPSWKLDGSAYHYLLNQLEIRPEELTHVDDNIQLDYRAHVRRYS